MSHWSRRRNLANSTEAAAVEWARTAPTSALVRIIAEDAAVRRAIHALDHGPASRFVEAAQDELDNRIPAPPGPHDVRE